MAPRKGNLMTVRTDVKVLDATIRDGGLCNNFEFTDGWKKCRTIYEQCSENKVDNRNMG